MAPVTPEDRWRIERGVDEMSRASRYLRFFSGVERLTDEQLDWFSHVDQVNHVAWGALDIDRADPPPGMGLGRFLRNAQHPQQAEFAIAVLDRAQNKGVGAALLGLLYLDAIERGIEQLTAWVLPENEKVIEWFQSLGASVRRDPSACDLRLPVRRHALRSASATPTARRLADLLDRLEAPLAEFRRSKR